MSLSTESKIAKAQAFAMSGSNSVFGSSPVDFMGLGQAFSGSAALTAMQNRSAFSERKPRVKIVTRNGFDIFIHKQFNQ